MNRINWIDWAKALAVCTVVFCHLPQSQDWFYYRYLQSVIIVIFFFLSGYLKKDRGSAKANWKKYWQGLCVPYLLYNLIVYPYWLLKFYMTCGAMPTALQALRPIMGTLLLQHENRFCEPLNGPLWYLPAILIMHLTVDLCRRSRHEHFWLIMLCIASFGLYAANKYWYFAPNLTPMGLMRNLPYYYIGYVCGQHKWFRHIRPNHDAIASVACLAASILLFAWHLHAFRSGQHLLHIALFYPVNLGFLFGVLYGCKLLDRWAPLWMVNLSVGTLIVIGLHIVIISIANIVTKQLTGIDAVPCYQWYEALPVALFIIALLYPVIVFSQKHFPALLGSKRLFR